jgi:hypothetical protein
VAWANALGELDGPECTRRCAVSELDHVVTMRASLSPLNSRPAVSRTIAVSSMLPGQASESDARVSYTEATGPDAGGSGMGPGDVASHEHRVRTAVAIVSARMASIAYRRCIPGESAPLECPGAVAVSRH